MKRNTASLTRLEISQTTSFRLPKLHSLTGEMMKEVLRILNYCEKQYYKIILCKTDFLPKRMLYCPRVRVIVRSRGCYGALSTAYKKFRTDDKWYGNFLKKFPRKSGSCRISERRTLQPKRKIKWDANFRKFGYPTSISILRKFRRSCSICHWNKIPGNSIFNEWKLQCSWSANIPRTF